MNRKEKNLRYIQEKNILRTGGFLYHHFKVNGEVIRSDDFQPFVLEMLQQRINYMSEKYRLNLKASHSEISCVDDDFVHDIKTLRFKIIKLK